MVSSNLTDGFEFLFCRATLNFPDRLNDPSGALYSPVETSTFPRADPDDIDLCWGQSFLLRREVETCFNIEVAPLFEFSFFMFLSVSQFYESFDTN